MENIYSTPVMDEVSVSAESGFAQSGWGGENFIIDPFLEGEEF